MELVFRRVELVKIQNIPNETTILHNESAKSLDEKQSPCGQPGTKA
jgi:hypothetical protein